jgi:sugar phosphate isomerase/epimerase
MALPSHANRRSALKTLAISAAGLSVFRPESAGCATPETGKHEPLKLGVATYSLMRLPTAEVVAALKELGIQNAGAFRGHINWKGTPEECRASAKLFQDAGIAITGSSVIELPNDEALVRKAFENTRAAGLPTIVCKPARNALGLIEKFVKEFDVRLAIHNHGPEDDVYCSPYDAWEVIQNLDPRIGVCIDVGHTARAGINPAEAIRKCRARLYDVHLKDTTAPVGSRDDVPVEVGRGNLDIRSMLAALIEINYPHIVEFEYEKKSGNPVVGLAQSIGYVRGVLASLAKA